MRIAIVLLAAAAPAAELKSALTFRATFDGTTDATVAMGDRRLYAAASYKDQGQATPGFGSVPAELVQQGGVKGGALRFVKKNAQALFYKADKNVAFDGRNWTGTISFWLNLSPDEDLEPGYCDPIQVTDKAYNDSAIWVDFTKDERPRHFRLGVFGELKAWNPQNLEPDKNPAFMNRLVVVKQPPFKRGTWTHIAITHQKLGGAGAAALYLNGQLMGTTPVIQETFNWDPAKGAIRLGVNYTGLMDDVAIFNRALTEAEIRGIVAGKF